MAEHISPAQVLPQIIDIAQAAGEKILEVRKRPYDVSRKKDRSPVTEADYASHHLIQTMLADVSDTPFLSEESSSIPFEKRREWEQFWIVDPLDGTQGFIRGSDDFTVNIALIEDGMPSLGVVHVPTKNESYYASRSHGAHKITGDGKATRIKARTKPAKEPTVAISVMHSGTTYHRMLEHLGPHKVVKRDSIIKSCMVAEGIADMYARFGPTGEWDTAAGQCILEEAGGRLTDMRGEPFRYNTKESLINPPFMAAAPSAPDWRGILNKMGYFDEKDN